MEYNKDKKLVFWGVGNICNECLKEWPEIRPVFFVDSRKGGTIIEGVPVISPEDISNWSDYFINITVQNHKEIKEILRKKGLIEGVDFVDYNEFYGLVGNESVTEYLSRLRGFAYSHSECMQGVLWFAPTIGQRAQQITDFINYYYSNKQVTIFTRMVLKDPKRLSKVGNAYKFDNFGDLIKNAEFFDVNKEYYDSLTREEQNWVDQMAQDALTDIKQANALAAEYALCKGIVDTMKPTAIVVWGGWVIRNYVLEEIARNRGISFAYAEYGELPGTMKVDKLGIEGKGEYAQYPDRLLRIEVTKEDIEVVEHVKAYIRSTHIDSIQFDEAGEEQQRLLNIDKHKPSIFFIGMDDNGKQICRGSEYWKRYLSSAFESSEAVAEALVEICNRKGWNLFAKPHPYTKFYIEQSENIYEFFDIEIDQLIQQADVVVSITSKADYKTLIYGKPLVQVGQTSLTGKGCGYEVYSGEELEVALENALKYGLTESQRENYNRHLAQLLKVSLWNDGKDREVLYGLSREKGFWEERI